uniref:Post-GPI attachment to proteins factor 3 n=1 Tax=Anthurium amnicola TaxID=1678845 RepID=A0A1D1YHF4_9ARAE
MSPAAAARWLVFFAALGCLAGLLDASAGDVDPPYRSCVDQCEQSGRIGDMTFRQCQFQSDGVPADGPWYMQEPLYLRWKQLNCESDCRYHCMMQRESERENFGLEPVKYHGKWPFKRVFVFQVCHGRRNLLHFPMSSESNSLSEFFLESFFFGFFRFECLENL